MAKYDTSDKHFQFRCCWTCQHCVLDLAQGYLCTANPRLPFPLALRDEDANVEIHKDRRGCKAYKRG